MRKECSRCGKLALVDGRDLCKICYYEAWQTNTLPPRKRNHAPLPQTTVTITTTVPVEPAEPIAFADLPGFEFTVPAHQWEVRSLNQRLIPLGYKWCKGCQSPRSVDQFKAIKNQYYGLSPRCRTCTNERNAAVRNHEQRRVSWRIGKYGLGPDAHQAMLDAQRGGCAICGKPPKKRPLAVDHDHATGAVRGLLCASCNTALGGFKDSPDLLHRAIAYLAAHNQK